MKNCERFNEIYLNSNTWVYSRDETLEPPLSKGERIQAFKDFNSSVVVRFYKEKDLK